MANQGKGGSPSTLEYNGRSTSDRKHFLVNNEFMSDVVFLVGKNKERIYAHKLFLIASSEYFHAMFSGNFKESSQHEIVMDDIEPKIFLEILRFIYCGKIELTFGNIHEIYTNSRKYMLMELLDMASNFLEKSLEPNNVLKIFTQNRFYGFQFVDEKCLRQITTNPLFYFNHEDFSLIDRESLCLILAAKKINCTDDQLMGALDIWEKGHETENVDELKTIIKDSKRSYDCYKLRFFGPSSGSEPNDFGFSIVSETIVNLYGIGVFLKSTARVISIEMKIWENDIEIGCDLFEYENDNFVTVDVANLFFEEIVLIPHHRYKISLNITPTVEPVTIQNPKIHHDRIKMSITNIIYGRCDSTYCAIAHMHCRERTSGKVVGTPLGHHRMDASNIMKMLTLVDQNLSSLSYTVDSPGHEGLKYDIPFMKRQESLINNKFQSDVTFLVGDKRLPIYAHKLLLIISSEYFNAMFNGNFKESNSEEIEVSDVEPDIFMEILRFIYCGKVRLTIENVLEIYVHAQKYMLNELRRRTVRFLEKHIDSDNVLKIFAQNRLYEFSFINEKCLTLIRKNPLTYFHHEDFFVLDRKSLEIIFASKRINCSDEQLFQALRDWKQVNESEYVNDLQTVISAKRSYNCAKLRFFGNMSMALHTDLKFSIDHTNSLAIFGIGVFVKSWESVVAIEVEISENLEILGRHRFDYENKDKASVNVANLFFEELTLRPDEWYTIAVKFSPSGECFTITNPQICHDKMRLYFDNNYSTMRSVVSHFYCEEIKK